jgi:hypothetical protein
MVAKSQSTISRNYYEGGSSRQHSRASDNDDYESDAPLEAGENFNPKHERIWYADWVRALAIQLVIFIHCLVNAADASGFDPELDPATQQKKDGIVKTLV